MLIVAHPLDLRGEREAFRHQTPARLTDQRGRVAVEGFIGDAADQGKDRLKLRHHAVQPVRGEAAAGVQAARFHARQAADLGRGAQIGVPGHRVRTLRTRMEGQRGDIAVRGHDLQQIDRLVHRRAELGAEVVGGPCDRQLEADRDFRARRHDLDQFLQLRMAVHGIGGHAHRHGIGDLMPGADGVVVMHGGARREARNHLDLHRRGDVKALDPGGDEVLDHHLVRVRLDRIGHKARKAVDEAARRGLQDRGREEHHRVHRLLIAKEFGRIRPDRLGKPHRPAPANRAQPPLAPA